MTMQNPDKPILAKDLNDYHNKILPYLGGMPEILANKFAKGDLYDTNERMIGKWIDGKPLYQKTITGTINNSATQTISHNITNIEKGWVIGFIITNKYSGLMDNHFSEFLVNSTTVEFKKTVASAYENNSCIITIQYTKTTDSAISIGNDTDYSTEEKIVGTWIDGSYIYQKTIDFTTGARDTNKYIDLEVGTINKTLQIFGYFVTGDGAILNFNPSYSNTFTLFFDVSNNRIGQWTNNNNYANKPCCATILYTKTS